MPRRRRWDAEELATWWITRGGSPVTIGRYIAQLEMAQRAHGLDLDRFTIGRAQTYYVRRRRAQHAPTFGAYADYKALNAYCDYLFGERPFAKPKVPKSRVPAPEDAEVRQLLAYRHDDAETSRLWRAVLFVELTVGWRNSELARLRDVDLDPANMRIRCAYPLKGGKVRWVPVPASTFSPKRPLMAYLARRPTPAPSAEGALFVTRSHGRQRTELARRVTAGTLRMIMAKVSAATGVRINHTRARHFVAVRLRRAGFDPLDIRDYLGHNKVQEVYLEDPNSLETRMRRRPPRDFYQGGI